MSSIPVNVKWVGHKPFDLEIDLEETGATVKLQIYSITGVEVDRQKISFKGRPIKDAETLSKYKIQANQTIMLIGSVEALPEGPTEKMTFVEDLNDSELALANKSPPGIENLGNTCYMNSTLQLLRAIPELQTELGRYSGGNLTGQLRDLYKVMDKTGDAINPVGFLNALRTVYPQFAQQSRSGHGYAQQDAEECWSQIIYTLRTNLRTSTGSASSAESSLDKFMYGRMNTVMRCEETDAEPEVESQESFVKLNCHIGASTNYMIDGIRDSLTDKIEKHSDVLERNASFVKKSSISRLPKYLNVNFVRFFFKTGIQKKAKILRKVGFPFELDATELCTAELRQKLAPIRDRVRDIQKATEDAERARKRTKTQMTDEGASASAISDKLTTMGTDSAQPDTAKEVESMMSDEMKQDVGANNCGLYELIGVLTHSGASADSGHYQSWMKAPTGDEWYRFNDDKVSIVPKEKIEALAGGGESDSIYIGLYKSKY